MPDKKKSGFFYGYVVVAAGLVTSTLLVGPFISFGVFFKPLSSEFGWMRATTSAATSIASLVMGFSAIAIGKLTDRYGPRVVLIACGLLIGAGNLLMSHLNAIWQLYLFYGIIIGTGMGAAEVPIVATVARWFVKRRGMMTGIAKVGAGIGIMAGPLLATWLISDYGWRQSYTIMGVTALVGLILVAMLFKRDPAQIGELPDGATEIESAESRITTHQFSVREAIRTRQFWTFAAAWFSFMFCMQVVTLHIVPHATDVGLSATIAASVLSVIGGFSILGRLGLTTLSDSLGTKSTYMITFSLLVISMLWLQFAREAWMFYLFAAIYGTAHGASFTMLSPMVADLFGLKSLGTILGIVLFTGTFGALISPVLAGRIFDIMGNYQLAFLIMVIFSIAALILISLLRPTGRGGTNEP